MVTLKDGVWPTMITPLTEGNRVDYPGLEELIEWYLAHGADGLFACCLSSEIFFLSRDERREIAGFVSRISNRRVQVVASGNMSDTLDDQIEEAKALADTGVDAVVLLTNLVAAVDESDDEWKRRVERLMDLAPDIALGLYECPYPSMRLLSTGLLEWCASTGRFFFLKDTSCDPVRIRERLGAVAGSGLKIYNACASTLLPSLEFGAAGYSGVMANFHPQLYAWLTRFRGSMPQKASALQNFLGAASLVEQQLYPVNAKYYLRLEGLNIQLNCRSRNPSDFTASNRLEVEQLRALTAEYLRKYEI